MKIFDSFRKLSNSGDTIVEVLFAIAVITAVLSASYAVTLRSLNDDLNNEDRSTAITLAEAQIEDLRTYVSSNTLPSSGTFCFYQNSTSGINLGTPDPGAPGPDNCQVNSAGFGGATSEPYYDLSINQTSPNNFSAEVQWLSAGSGSPDNVTMFYTMYVN